MFQLITKVKVIKLQEKKMENFLLYGNFVMSFTVLILLLLKNKANSIKDFSTLSIISELKSRNDYSDSEDDYHKIVQDLIDKEDEIKKLEKTINEKKCVCNNP